MGEKGLKAGQTRKGKIPLVEQFGFLKTGKKNPPTLDCRAERRVINGGGGGTQEEKRGEFLAAGPSRSRSRRSLPWRGRTKFSNWREKVWEGGKGGKY